MKDKQGSLTLGFFTDKGNIHLCALAEGGFIVTLRDFDKGQWEDARDCFSLEEGQAIELRDFLNYAYPKED